MRELIDQLMNADDASGLDFVTFAEMASEKILFTDHDDYQAVQIILAVLRGDDELALKMAERFRDPLRNLAEQMLKIAIDSQRE